MPLSVLQLPRCCSIVKYLWKPALIVPVTRSREGDVADPHLITAVNTLTYLLQSIFVLSNISKCS